MTIAFASAIFKVKVLSPLSIKVLESSEMELSSSYKINSEFDNECTGLAKSAFSF